jgi:hypothetical protein
MNERIQELSREAWEYADKHTQDGDGNFGMVHTYKFAELLLEDVRNVITDVYQEVPFAQSVQFLYLEEEIVEHFYGTPRKFER